MKIINLIIPVLMAILFSSCGTAPALKEDASVPGTYDIAITGDIMTGRDITEQINTKGADYPFEDTAAELKKCAVIFGNLESPLVHESKEAGLVKKGKKQVYLFSEEKAADGIKDAGFNILSLANNHALDYGQDGLNQTIEILQSKNIDFCGIRKGDLSKANEPCIKEVNGAKVGFLCYSDVSNREFYATKVSYGTIPALMAEIEKDIKNARSKVDVLVIYLHWGKEDNPVQEIQYASARQIIDMGADIIIGSHTHVFQDVEIYKGKYIFYGMGNFVFDMKREDSKYSAILKLKVENKKITKLKLVPVYLENNRPVIIKDKDRIFDFLSGIKLINASLKEIY
jgi:gamma-polyglutamate biosynthesis protein CapA